MPILNSYFNLDSIKFPIVASYDPDSQFTMSALSRLEDVGIPVMTSLFVNTYLFRQVLSVIIPYLSVFYDTPLLLNAWISYGMSSSLPPTWKNLLLIIRLLNLGELAQQVETYLSGSIEEQHSEIETIKSERE